MLLLALMPGIPMLPFLALGGGASGLAWHLGTQAERQRPSSAEQAAAKSFAAVAAGSPAAEEPISSALKIDDLKIELGYALLPLVNSARMAATV